MKRSRALAVSFLTAAVAFALPVAAEDSPQQCVDASSQAVTLRGQGKLLEARAKLITCAVDACGPTVKEFCAKRLTDVNAALPSIILLAKDGAGNDLADVKLSIDGVARAEQLDGRAISLNPGKHLFKLEVSGQPPVEKELLLAEAQHDRSETFVVGPVTAPVRVPVPSAPASNDSTSAPSTSPSATPESSSWSTQKTLAIVSGGVGLAGVALGTVFGLSASSKWSSAKADCGTGCGPNDAARQEKSDAQSAATLSTIMFAVGGVGLAGAVVLWLTAPSGTESAPPPSAATAVKLRLVPTIGLGGAGMILNGAF